MKKTALLILALCVSVSHLQAQTGDQLATVAATLKAAGGGWAAVPQNSSFGDALLGGYHANGGHIGNPLGYGGKWFYDYNRGKGHFIGNDHDDYPRYVTLDRATNNWTLECYEFKGYGTLTAPGGGSHVLNIPGGIHVVSSDGSPPAGTTLVLYAQGSHWNTSAPYTIISHDSDTQLTLDRDPTDGSAASGGDGDFFTNGCMRNVAHNYEHMTGDPITGNIFSKEYSPFASIKLWQMNGGTVSSGNPFTKVLDIGGTSDQAGTATGWWDGPVIDADTNKNSDSGGSWYIYNCNEQSIYWYSPRRATVIKGIGTGNYSTDAGNYQCEADYDRINNILVFGGGNGGLRDDTFKLWMVNAYGTVTQLTDPPIPVGILHGGPLQWDPASHKFLLMAFQCMVTQTCSSTVDTNLLFYSLDPLTFNNSSGRYGVYTSLTAPPVMTTAANIGTGIAVFGDNTATGGISTASADELGMTLWLSCTEGTCSLMAYMSETGLTHTQQCAATGVIKCFEFDTSTDLQQGCNAGHGSGLCANGEDPTRYANVTLDTSTKADGVASMKMTIPNVAVGASPDADWFGNFSDDFSLQFGPASSLGPSSTFFVGYVERMDSNYISNNWAGGGGWKHSIVGEGDGVGFTAGSCSTEEMVIQNTNYRGFPQMYNSCTGSSSHGPYNPTDEFLPPFDLKEENVRPLPGCLYSQQSGGYVPPSTCAKYTADQWRFYESQYILGPRGAGGLIDTFTKSGTAPAGSGSVTNIGADSTSGPGQNAKFDVSWSGGVYTVTNHDPVTLTTGSRGSGYLVNGSSTLTILGTHFTGGATPANDLTITVTGALFNVIGAPPNDEAVMSYLRLWVAEEGSTFLQPVITFGPFGVSFDDPAFAETVGKLWLTTYDTGRSDTKPAANAWFDMATISRNAIPAPTVNAVPAPNFTLSKAAPGSVNTSSAMTYTIGLGNSGTATSGTSATVADQLPAGVTASACTAGTGVTSVSCTNLGVSGGLIAATVTLTSGLTAGASNGAAAFTITATSPSSAGTIVNNASVDSSGGSSPPLPSCGGTNCASASTTVNAAPSSHASRIRLKP